MNGEWGNLTAHSSAVAGCRSRYGARKNEATAVAWSGMAAGPVSARSDALLRLGRERARKLAAHDLRVDADPGPVFDADHRLRHEHRPGSAPHHARRNVRDVLAREVMETRAAQLRSLLEEERDLIANAANMASLLFHSLPDLNWAGFYLLCRRATLSAPRRPRTWRRRWRCRCRAKA